VYYAIGEIYTNGAAVGVASNLSSMTYVWSNVQADGTLYVEFAPPRRPRVFRITGWRNTA
jgi:hypothetical protein